VCSSGTCGVTCLGGSTLCTPDGGVAACVQTASDPNNCGACGTVCPAGQVCAMGACGIMCAGGSSLCGTTCTNLSNDPNNCSACGKVCPGGANATAVCSASACSYVCTAGHADCNGLSADGCEATLATDDN